MMRIFELNSETISIIFAICMVLLAISLRLMIELMDMRPKSKSFLLSVAVVLVNFFLTQFLAELGSKRMLAARAFLNISVLGFAASLVGIAALQIIIYNDLQSRYAN